MCIIGLNSTIYATDVKIKCVNKNESEEHIVLYSITNATGKVIAVPDDSGQAILKVDDATGFVGFIISTGFYKYSLKIAPNTKNTNITAQLLPIEFEQAEITVTSTRTEQFITESPTRVEGVGRDEIDEKINMLPSNVSMLVNESNGVKVQQTSPSNGNVSIRMQGLDGRYTQILRNGYPGYGDFSGGLGLLSIPPLNLKQVELIKGPATTLFGSGAITGLINFVTKDPEKKGEFSTLLNQSSVGATDISMYNAKRWDKFGYTILGMYNYQKIYDVDKDGFSEAPQTHNFTINPSLFFYPNKDSKIKLEYFLNNTQRKGGYLQEIAGNPANSSDYRETQIANRNIFIGEFSHDFNTNFSFLLKSATSLLNRKIISNFDNFNGTAINNYTDASIRYKSGKNIFVAGLNYYHDQLNDKSDSVLYKKNYRIQTQSLYIQHSFNIKEKYYFEEGLRAEMNQNQKLFLLPRVSGLWKINQYVSTRLGGGLGYKNPSLFTEGTESRGFRSFRSIDPNLSPERSYGATFDVSYKTLIAKNVTFTINQMIFYTGINNSVAIQEVNNGYNFIYNQPGLLNSKGYEFNAKWGYKHWSFWSGYSYIYAQYTNNGSSGIRPLSPKNKFSADLLYDISGKIRLGLEGYYTGQQQLTNGQVSKDYWIWGLFCEYKFKYWSFFVNFENFTDTRQSRYANSKVLETNTLPYSRSNPQFNDIWTDVIGFYVNGGIKIAIRQD